MFGYITICEPELKMKDFRRYKAYYCGLCHTLKKRYGFTGQMTLTYDMTFSILLLTSLYETDTNQITCRCKVHPVKKQTMLENDITEYAADMNVILAFYHLKDDWLDEKKTGSLIGMRLLHRKVQKIMRQYPRQCRAIQKSLKELAAYENAGEIQPDLPAGCFGHLMEELLVYKKDHWEPYLRKLGFFLGKFIYLMDAYEDLEKDQKDGCYNPLIKLYEKPGYEERMKEMLCMMIAECSAQFEHLPCIQEVDILRNILYDGVWNKYKKIQERRKKERDNSNDEKSL